MALQFSGRRHALPKPQQGISGGMIFN